MKAKDVLIVGLLFALIVVSYLLGYRTGALRETLRNDTRALIVYHTALYHAAESGDSQKVRSSLGMILLGEVRTYQHQFGDETGNDRFAAHFQDAKIIADQLESQLVPASSILTNIPHTPGAKITVGN